MRAPSELLQSSLRAPSELPLANERRSNSELPLELPRSSIRSPSEHLQISFGPSSELLQVLIRTVPELCQNSLRALPKPFQNSTITPSEPLKGSFRTSSGLLHFRVLSEIQFVLYNIISIKCKSVTQSRLLSRSRTSCFKCALDHSSHPDPYLVAGPTISKAPYIIHRTQTRIS